MDGRRSSRWTRCAPSPARSSRRRKYRRKPGDCSRGSARVRGAPISLWQEDAERRLDLQADGAGFWADGAGFWADGAGRRLPELDGCTDLDIADYPGQWRRRGATGTTAVDRPADGAQGDS